MKAGTPWPKHLVVDGRIPKDKKKKKEYVGDGPPICTVPVFK